MIPARLRGMREHATSCPPPKMPSQLPGSIDANVTTHFLRKTIELVFKYIRVHNRLCLRGGPGLITLRQSCIAQRQDASRQQPGVLGPRRANGQSANRNSAGIWAIDSSESRPLSDLL